MMIKENSINHGDCQQGLLGVADNSIATVHTSPPYNIGKDYSGYKDSLAKREYLSFMEEVVDELYRVLKPGGSLFWQTGYTNAANDCIYPIDHLTFDIFMSRGFQLKDRVIWRYYGGMSFKSKFTNKHETILWWVKPGAKPYFDVFPIRERSKELDPRNNLFGRNPGNVWSVDRVAYGSLQQTSHIAVFPEEISDRILLSTTRPDDICLDPFSGSGTLCKIAKARGRRYIGFEIAKPYYDESVKRLLLIPSGEYKNLLFNMIKFFAFGRSQTADIARVFDYVYLLLKSYDVHATGLFRTDEEFRAVMEKNDTLSKKSKVELWTRTDEYFSNQSNKNEPLFVLNACLQRSHKLAKVFNGVMRIHRLHRLYESFVETEDELYATLNDIIEEAQESFDRKGNTIRLVNKHMQVKGSATSKKKKTSKQVSFTY